MAAYQAVLAGAVGDVFQVGESDDVVKRSPLAAHQLLIGSMWYLNDHPIQNTYTAVSYRAYKRRYCVYYQGNTCPGLLDTLFSTEPTTGKQRVDLLGRELAAADPPDFPPIRLNHPPAGWQIADRGRFSVLWTRRTPVPGAGGVVWTSPGTSVSGVERATTARRSVSTRSRRAGARPCSACSTGPATPPTWGAWPIRSTGTS